MLSYAPFFSCVHDCRRSMAAVSDRGISLLQLLLLLLLAHCITISHCACVNSTLRTGIFFRCELSVQEFEFSTTQGTIISSSVRQVGFAGAPSWVQSAVDYEGGTVLLYGTPTEQDTGNLQLVVTAQRDDFTVSVVSIQLTVQPLQGQVFLYSEFYVTNFNMDEILVGARYTVLTIAVREVYSDLDPAVLAFIDPQDRGIAIPPPPARLGVLVQVTPGLNLKDAPQDVATEDGCEETHTDIFSSHGFDVALCLYQLQYTEETPASNTSQTTPPVGVVIPSPEESSVTLIVIMVVVGVSVCIALSVCTCVFFCKRRFASTLTKSRRRNNATILGDTNSSVLEVNKAQVVLRSLSSAQTATIPPTQWRPQSTETCLEYQEVPSESFDGPPPDYQYNEELLRSNSSSTPSL